MHNGGGLNHSGGRVLSVRAVVGCKPLSITSLRRMDAIITQLPTVPRTPFLDAQSLVGSDDDVVDDGDANDFCGLFQSLGDTDVLIARGGVTAGMVVDDEDTVGSIADGGAEDFAGMDEAIPQSSNCDLMAFDRNVLRVERHDPEFFLDTLTGHSTELVQTELHRRRRAGYTRRGFVFGLEFRDPESDLDASHKSIHGIVSHARADCLDLFGASFGQFLQSKLLHDLDGISVRRCSFSPRGQGNQLCRRTVQQRLSHRQSLARRCATRLDHADPDMGSLPAAVRRCSALLGIGGES